jgi:putative integral membrane protein (TIGR02587 family)
MSDPTAKNRSAARPQKRFLIDLARAYGGALIFSFPMLMTMEMWWLGFGMSRFRLGLFMIVGILLLAGLSFYEGFADTFSGKDDILETFTAYFVGFTTSALLLFLFGIITTGMSADEIIGKISLQAVTAALGAIFAEAILGGDDEEVEDKKEEKRTSGYGGQLFLMVVGAVFLAMSLAATEEMLLISYLMTDWQTVVLMILTILTMHGFVYAARFGGSQRLIAPDVSFLSIFLRFTVVGYAIVLLVSFYILWTFGMTDDLGPAEKLKAVVVLGFPAALGSAASRLLL